MKFLSQFIFLSILSLSAIAQQADKLDVVLQLNGDEVSGKVVEIADDAIKFVHKDESLVYSMKKADIVKITFASGRIEVYNKPQLSSASGTRNQQGGSTAAGESGSDHHNKIAILPFAFVKEGQKAADEMSNIVQNSAFTFLNKHAGVLQVMDTRTTNAKLIKAGVTRETLAGYTMDDICNILGVEFIVDGTVLLNKVSAQTLASNTYSDKTKYSAKDTKTNAYGSTSAASYENYETIINVDIYNDKGNNMFSQSRKSFFKSQDAYQSAMEYVLKRSPLYSK